MSLERADGNVDQSSAIAPVTNGPAMLVPLLFVKLPPGALPITDTPGAISPRPIEIPRLVSRLGTPRESHAATGISQEFWLSASRPTCESFPAGAMIIVFRRRAYSHASVNAARVGWPDRTGATLRLLT